MKKPKTTTATFTTPPFTTTDPNSSSHTTYDDGSEPPLAQRFEKVRENGGDEAEGEGGEEEEEYEEEDEDAEEEEEVGDEYYVEERGSGGCEDVVAATTAEENAKRQNLAEGFFEVEAIRKKRIIKGEPQYLIKWRGWPESANTWEPVDHLQTCPDVVEAYEESLQSGQKKGRKRKRKFTPQKKGQYSYGVSKSKTSPINMPLSNEPQDSAALDHLEQTHPEPSVVDLVVRHEETRKRPRSARKADRNGFETISSQVGSSVKDHPDSTKLSGEKATVRNLDVHMQHPMHIDGDGPADQQSKSTCVETGQSNPQRGAKRRKSGSVRRFTQDMTSFNIDYFGTPLPVNASTNDRVEQPTVGSSEASRKKKADSSRGSSVITKIIKPIRFSASVTNNNQDVSVTFVAMRSDGKEVIVDNKFLKSTNPLLLINFYEQHLRYNPN